MDLVRGGAQAERMAQAGLGFGQAALVEPGEAEADMGDMVLGVELDGLGQLFGGLVEGALLE